MLRWSIRPLSRPSETGNTGLQQSCRFYAWLPKTHDVHQKSFKTVWRLTLRRAGIQYFRIYDLRSTYATRLSAGGVADEWVTQLLRQGDAKVFKKYSQMKLQMKREALQIFGPVLGQCSSRKAKRT